MARATNIFSGDTATPVGGIGMWELTNAGHTIETEGGPTNVSAYLHLLPTSPSSDVVISIPSIEIPSAFRGTSVDFGFYIKCDEKIVLSISGENPAGISALPEPEAVVSQTVDVRPTKGIWAFPRLNRISAGVVETPQFVSLSITISGHNGSPIYFARPILVPTLFHAYDTPTLVVQSQMPPEIMDIDELATPVVAGLARLLHISTVAYQDVYGIVDDIENLDHVDSWNEGKGEFSSKLTNPTLVDVDTARWLAQFTGAPLVDSSAGLTPWANLPKVWANWADIDTADPGTDVDWSEIEAYDIELIGLEEYFRWQLQTNAYSSRGGTYGAMYEAAQRVLSGTKTIILGQSPTSPFTITAKTIVEETTPVLLAAALYASKPAGFALDMSYIS